jgi:ribose transport system permease protein
LVNVSSQVARWWSESSWRRAGFAVWIALALLFAVSPLLASGSLSGSSLLSMLPFAAVLIIASIGQTLVIQQGGLDFSVPGSISLAAVIVTHYANQHNGRLLAGIVLALVACGLSGLLNGLLVAVARVPAIIATLGVNALLNGAATQYSGGNVTTAPSSLSHFMVDKAAGIPNTIIIAVVIVIIAAVILRRTPFGRRYELCGTSPAAARIAGMPVRRLTITGYIVAGVAYGAAGVVLAGYTSTPDVNAGDPYLLSTVAAVVLGGASLAGGRASVLATGAGALFLEQLNQVVLSSGANVWAQYLIQGGVVGLGMTLRLLPERLAVRRQGINRWRRPHARDVAPATQLPASASTGAETAPLRGERTQP